MLFVDKKLDLGSIDELIQCPIHTVEPYALMLSPVYVLMKLNKKLVSVKAPLDFFTPEELTKLKTYETFYLPKFVHQAVRFQTAARLSHKILSTHQDPLFSAPYELSKELLTALTPLWGKQVKIEPFFMTVFSDEFCKSLNPEKMIWARENKVVSHEYGLMLAGAFIFVALHLGWFEIEKLNTLRSYIYEKVIEDATWAEPTCEADVIICELHKMLQSYSYISYDVLKESKSEWSKKLLSRLNLIVKNQTLAKYESPSISGPEGFAA